jgi:heme-degrading monooxygenase HmoA
MASLQTGWAYLIIWEFYVREGRESRFEQIYGPEGDWARLFSRSREYRGTQLSRDSRNSRRYVTLDFWSSDNAYHEFRQQYQAEYQAMDRNCEELTEREAEIGTFLGVS